MAAEYSEIQASSQNDYDSCLSLLNALLNHTRQDPEKRKIILKAYISRLRLKDYETLPPAVYALAHYILDEREAGHPIDNAELILLACLEAYYKAYNWDTQCLPQTVATLMREHQGAAKLRFHITSLAGLEHTSPGRVNRLHSRGIYAPEDYDRDQLIAALQQEETPPQCDLLLHFPRPAYTSGAAHYVERTLKKETDETVTEGTPPPTRIHRPNADLPLAIIEGREPDQISEAMRQYRKRVRWLFIHTHGWIKGMQVVGDPGKKIEINRKTINFPWVQSILDCLDPEDPTGCSALLSCDTGNEGGIAEQWREESGRVVFAPMGLSNRVTLQIEDGKTRGQFWVINKAGVYVPQRTRVLD